MPESHEKHNTKTKFYKSPTDRLDLLSALTKAQAKEQAKGKKHKKLLEQVDLFVMLALLGHRNNKTGQCDPSHEAIAAEIGVSESTVKRSFNRLIAAGFIATTAKYFKALRTSSQVDIAFEKAEPWISAKSDDARSLMTERSVTDDRTLGHGCTSGSVTDDPEARSLMTDKHSEVRPSEDEHSENEHSAPSASRRDGPAASFIDGDDAQRKGANDNAMSLDDQVAKLESAFPENAEDDTITDIYGTRPVKVTTARIRSKLKSVLEDGDKFDEILAGVESYRRHIDAWCGDRKAKSIIQFIDHKIWKESCRFESDVPPPDFVPKCAKPWPEDYRDRFRSGYPSRTNVQGMTPEKVEAELKRSEAELAKIAATKTVTFESVEQAVFRYRTSLDDLRFTRSPVKWLVEEPWKQVAANNNFRPVKQVKRMAI